MNWFYRSAAASQQRIDFLARKYDRIVPRKTIETLSQIDPTPNGQFTEWLVRLHAIGPGKPGYFPVTDAMADWAKYVLTEFMRFKNSPQFTSPKDINQYKSLDMLENALREPAQLSNQERARQNAQAGQNVLYQDSNYRVLAITNSDAATQYCKNTAICLKDPRTFSGYNISANRPAYIILKYTPSQSGFGNGFVNPNMEPYAVFFPQTGEFNCMDNNSIFQNGLGPELVSLMKKVPNGESMLREYMTQLLTLCENPKHYEKLGDTLDEAMWAIGGTPQQWRTFENIVGAYRDGYDSQLEDGDVHQINDLLG